MTLSLQNLSKILDKYESQLGSTNAQQFELLSGLSFYNWRASFDENHAQKLDLDELTLLKMTLKQ